MLRRSTNSHENSQAPTRAIQKKAGVGPNAPSVFIERDVAGTAGKPRMPVELTVNGNVLRLVLRDPTSFDAGKYVLNCLGTSPVATVGPAVKAFDDSSPLIIR